MNDYFDLESIDNISIDNKSNNIRDILLIKS